MKILFLDIDGCLNSYQSFELIMGLGQYWDLPVGNDLCPMCCSNLETIINITGCKIVISSSWRHGSDLEIMRGWFSFSKIISEAIIDKTPEIFHAQRGTEIKKWLEDHPEVTHFAALDDDEDMDDVKEHFFRSDARVGLDYILSRKIIQHLIYLNVS